MAVCGVHKGTVVRVHTVCIAAELVISLMMRLLAAGRPKFVLAATLVRIVAHLIVVVV